jgi:hypothetical protein
VISPLSFQSYPPAIGSASSAYSLNNQYAIAQAAGVTSTRIYTTVGASNLTNCLTSSCMYGGAVKAMYQARAYNMTGAAAIRCCTRRIFGHACPAFAAVAHACPAFAAPPQSPWALRCRH